MLFVTFGCKLPLPLPSPYGLKDFLPCEFFIYMEEEFHYLNEKSSSKLDHKKFNDEDLDEELKILQDDEKTNEYFEKEDAHHNVDIDYNEDIDENH